MISPQHLSSIAVSATLVFSSAVQATPILGCGVAGSPAPYTVNCDQSVSGTTNSGPYTATYPHNRIFNRGLKKTSAFAQGVFDQTVTAQNDGRNDQQHSNGATAPPSGINLTAARNLLSNASEAGTVVQNTTAQNWLGQSVSDLTARVSIQNVFDANADSEVSLSNMRMIDGVIFDDNAGSRMSRSATSPVSFTARALVIALGSESSFEEFADILTNAEADIARASKEDNSITQQITTISISSGGNLPGLGVDNSNLGNVSFAVAEPNVRWLWLIALPLFVSSLRSRKSMRAVLR